MRHTKRHAEPLSATDMPALYGGARALVLSAEAVRLSWNRASQRIIHEAQERVALEPAGTPKPSR